MSTGSNAVLVVLHPNPEYNRKLLRFLDHHKISILHQMSEKELAGKLLLKHVMLIRDSEDQPALPLLAWHDTNDQDEDQMSFIDNPNMGQLTEILASMSRATIE
jgi:hypothetical protein